MVCVLPCDLLCIHGHKTTRVSPRTRQDIPQCLQPHKQASVCSGHSCVCVCVCLGGGLWGWTPRWSAPGLPGLKIQGTHEGWQGTFWGTVLP